MSGETAKAKANSKYRHRRFGDDPLNKHPKQPRESVSYAQIPAGRFGHSAVALSDRVMAVFGGSDGYSWFNTTHLFDLQSDTWVGTVTTSCPPDQSICTWGQCFASSSYSKSNSNSNSSEQDGSGKANGKVVGDNSFLFFGNPTAGGATAE